MRRIILAGALLSIMVGVACGGWLDDAIKNAGEGLGKRSVNDSASGVYDGAKGTAKDAVKGSGKPAGDPDGSGSAPGSKRSTAKGATTGGDGAAAGDGSIEQAETVYSKYDFIPGDKVIFFDDFSDTDVGEFPRKWHLNGPLGGKNAVEVVEYQGKRFLRSAPGAKGQRDSTQYLRLNQTGDLPEKFTVEFDAVFAPHNNNPASAYHTKYRLLFLNKGDGWKYNAPRNPGVIELSGTRNQSNNTETNIGKSDGKLHHVAVSVNGTFVKAYVDNIRVINDPDGAKRPITMVGLTMEMANGFASDKVMFTNFRLAEGGKNIKSALDTDGKIVTHGILFDTGKDIIKAESLPTLKSILAILNDTPDLKFSIEGHTDNQGSRGINQPLSEKRAEAVKAWLVGKGIDADRLRSKGWGDTKPIDKNESVEGRANNRRVEFVKF
jgi:OOP family OmpA-OmpF porin